MKGIKTKIILLILIPFFFFACAKPAVNETSANIFNVSSFRDIPGVTEAEIAAIEELQRQNRPLVFSVPLSTEAFIGLNGEIMGFVPRFCDWMCELFDIQFQLDLDEFGSILMRLGTREVDLSFLAVSEELQKSFILGDPVVYRTMKIMQLEGVPSPQEIKYLRPVRYVFTARSPTMDAIAYLEDGQYEIVIADSYYSVYRALESGEADAFISYNVAEAAFDSFGGVVVRDFLPLMITPGLLITGDIRLSPIISVVSKALKSGAHTYLTDLYRQGYQDYRRNKLFSLLNEEETAFIRNNPVIPFTTQSLSYPVSFFDRYENKWGGIVFDVLGEIEKLTGLKFELTDDPMMDQPLLLTSQGMMTLLEDGRAYFIPNLIKTEERRDNFIWSDINFIQDRFALLSKQNFPDVDINDIPFLRVGLSRGSGHADMFHLWFPNALYVTEYPNNEEAFLALDRGEVDLVMSSQTRLAAMTNYHELSDYKANFLFDAAFEANFAFNKEKTTLRSIIDKTLPLINTDRISEQWMTRTYNIETMRLRQQRPWFIRVITLTVCIIILIIGFYVRSIGIKNHLEVLVAERTEELVNASEAKSRFLANMSHEIRTPMNVILGITDSRLMSGDIPDKEKEAFEKVHDSGHLLLGIINDILDLSKIEAGKFELVPVKYDIMSLIYDTANMWNMRYGDKDLKFILTVKENIPVYLYGDELRIKQVLNNLISNAFKYTERGEVELIFDSEWIVEPKITKLMISIRDTGQGLSKAQLDQLFKTEYVRFNQEANRKITGTGLGMTITCNMVKMMEGNISVESEAGKGSVFTVSLPQDVTRPELLDRETADKLQNFNFTQVKRKEQTKITREPMPYGKILVVDDMKSNLDVAKLLLKPYQLQVETAESGFDAIELIKSGKEYDIVFMDYMMPKMDGLETTKKIREEGYTRAIIALTANAIAGQQEIFLANGFDGYISKPIDIRNLNDVLNKFVRDKEQNLQEQGK